MIEIPPELPTELMAWLRSEEVRCVDAKLDEQRKVAIDFYHGAPFGDEEEGRSQLVTRDVAEVIDYMTVSVLRTMVSGDRVVEFEAERADQVDQAEAATELVAWQFMRAQPGYRILHDWLKAGLLEKSGIVKTWVEPQSEVIEDLVPAEALAALQEQLVAAEPADAAESLWRVRLRRDLPPLYRDAAVPNEEFRVAPDARSLEEAAYLVHCPRKSLSDLIRMGFDPGLVESCWGDNPDCQVIEQARDRDRSGAQGHDHRTGQGRVVVLREEYVLYDLDGDGVTERLCIHRVGNSLLGVQQVDDQPFVLWCPFPMQHRLIGQSLADKVIDIQRTRSVMLRQAMDNLYLSNAPRLLLAESSIGDNTIDDLLTVRPGALVRYKGAQPPVPLTTPFVADGAFKAMEIMAGERESRTGITRLNQGLDADTLNKTATGTALMQASGQQIEEYLARNFAEGIAELFEKKLKLMIRHGGAQTVPVAGGYRAVDPATLAAAMRIRVRVGLGSGRKDQRLAYRMQLLGLQKEALAAGEPLVTIEHLYNNLKGMVADAGLGSIAQFFADPDTLKDEDGRLPLRPDPAMAAQQAKQAADLAYRERELDLDHVATMARIARDAEAKQQAAAVDAGIKRARAAEEARLARDRLEGDFDLRLREMAQDAVLAAGGGKGDPPRQDLPGYRPGGDLSQ